MGRGARGDGGREGGKETGRKKEKGRDTCREDNFSIKLDTIVPINVVIDLPTTICVKCSRI